MPVKGMLALYIGGMGARGKNFYNDYAKRLGYEAAAVKIQDLYLDGKKAEAMAAVPDELVDEIALVGPKERIRERLAAWKASPRDRRCWSAPASPRRCALLAELRCSSRPCADGIARASRADRRARQAPGLASLHGDGAAIAARSDPLVVERAEGSCLFDVDGRAYLDANSSWWVVDARARHPRLVAALRASGRSALPHGARGHHARGRARSSPRRSAASRRPGSSTSSTATTARPRSRSR